MIALTFDEGPSDYTLNVQKALAAANASVTFHVVTAYLNQVTYSALVKQSYKAGHIIGIRFPTTANLISMSDDVYVKTLQENSARIYELVGVYPKYLRLPAGGYQERHIGLAQSMGFQITTWSLDFFDYNIADKAKAANQDLFSVYKSYIDPELQRVARGTASYILLLHDQYPVYLNETILPAVVTYLRNQYGYNIVTMDKCLLDKSPYRGDNNDPRNPGTKSVKSGAMVPETSWAALALAFVAFIFVLF